MAKRDTAAARKINKIFSDSGLEIGFFARHLQTGTTISRNADALFPTASVFKVPVMAEVYRQAAAGRFALSDRIALEARHKTLSSGVMQTLSDGLSPTIRDLCVLMIIVSDNTATEVLLERIGIDNVNKFIHSLGLNDIHVSFGVHAMFLHAWGLPLDAAFSELWPRSHTLPMDYQSLTFARTPKSTVASARATAELMALLAERKVVSPEASRDMINILRDQTFNNRVARYLPWGKVAHKTGSMRGLRNDAGVIQRSRDDRIAFALCTFDSTPLPGGNSVLLAKRDHRVDDMMARVGRVLWDDFR
jgi:beta-lactamase class A